VRKHKTVTIEAEGRDKGKSFLLVEMSAMQAEKWATRALLALGRSGIEVPDEAVQAGSAAIMAAGLASFTRLAFDDAEPLLEEMLGCVAFVPDAMRTDPATGRPLTRPLARGDQINDGDIEEVLTLVKIRAEVAELHLGFSVSAALSTLAAEWMTSRQPTTRTSRKPAPRASRRAKPA
jgi:hypothetical protein